MHWDSDGLEQQLSIRWAPRCFVVLCPVRYMGALDGYHGRLGIFVAMRSGGGCGDRHCYPVATAALAMAAATAKS